ncbi:AraC family transcriptional regulator [Rhizobium paknamense]|uniref:AraC-like DNA-binding protein n=1 Tax=Rhizobium paknamense TaxID=1206817 RepID=A0ABU0IG30_9HYPH|nr:AraC family transcriptional regulator [Rhizobium paknamense]MDQ0456380.1 AraC-like DNA-binding protein [Rhizobium paknamense]
MDAPSIKQLMTAGDDAEALEQTLSSPASPITVDARPVPLRFRWNSWKLGAHTISRAHYEGIFSTNRKESTDKCVIFLPFAGSALIDSEGKISISSPEKATLQECRRNTRMSLNGPRDHIALIIDKADLARHTERYLETSLKGELRLPAEWDVTSGTGLIFRTMAQTLHAELSRHPDLLAQDMCRARLTMTLNSMLTTLLPHNLAEQFQLPAPIATPRHVSRAIDFMEANLHKPISLEDIAAASGVGARTLQQSFRQFKDTTPTVYLQSLRLECVRRTLLEAPPGSSVAEIAARWGFSHAGRFAVNYRQRFGESPSTTLKR